MALNYDIGLFNNDAFIDPNVGDFDISPSDEQHIIDNIAAFPGWWKEFPQDGVGILQYENSSGQEQVIGRQVKLQLQSDGYQVTNPVITQSANGNLSIQPNATKN